MLILALVLMAAGLDYPALVQEFKEAPNDPEIQAYLAEHLLVAREMERLQDMVKTSAANAKLLRNQAPEADRRRKVALTLLATNDAALQRMAEAVLREPDAAALIARSDALEESARDGLIQVVSRYREIKAEIVAAKTKTVPAQATR